MPVIAVGEIFGISGRRSELLDVLTRAERHVRQLPGVRRYAFAARLDAPDEFVLISEWDSHDAMAGSTAPSASRRISSTFTASWHDPAR